MDRNDTNSKRALTIAEAAKHACVGTGTVRNWITSRVIPFEELPSHGKGHRKFRLIRKNDLDEFLDSHLRKPNQPNKAKPKKELILLPRKSVQ